MLLNLQYLGAGEGGSGIKDEGGAGMIIDDDGNN